jgi:hypothetical protein
MSGMASTGTGALGRNPTFQLKGAVTIPKPMISRRSSTVTSLFSRKNLMILFSIIGSGKRNRKNQLPKQATAYSPNSDELGYRKD